MPRSSPIQTSFNAGEISPKLEGRVDIPKYGSAVKLCENYLPLIQGPATRRGGWRFVGTAKDQSPGANRAWLVRFEFNTQQAYILEFGDQYIRFWTNHGQVISGGVPYEISSPYTSADLTDANGDFNLRMVESADVVYIAHPNYAPRKLSRLAPTNWTLTTLVPIGGPFKARNITATTVYASAATGAVTLNASSPIFAAGHVGSLFRLEQKSIIDIKQWEPGKPIVANDLRRSDGKTYKALNAATTGGNRPLHTEGAVYDGDAGVQWEFQDPGFGIVQITGYTSTTVVTGTVVPFSTATTQAQLPAGCVGAGNPTARWSFGDWSDVEGWPTQVNFFRGRLSLARKQKIWQSVAGDFESFTPVDGSGLVTADMAINITLQSSEVNDIQWIEPVGASIEALLCGTAGAEFSVRSQTENSAYGPANVTAPPLSAFGSMNMIPAKVGNVLLFVQRAGTKLRDLTFEPLSGQFGSADQSVLAEHITKPALSQLAYQQEPHSILWATRSDGQLVAMTYMREQYPDAPHGGWHRHPLAAGAGIVESIAVIPAPDGLRDELWAIVRMTINGATVRYVCYQEREFDSEEGMDPEDAFFVDAGLTLDNTIAATLTPGAGATVAHTVDVPFSAGSAVFAAGDVGKQIHYRYTITDGKNVTTFHTAKATITGYVSPTDVTCTVDAAFPSLALIPSNAWRMTVTTLSGLDHLEGQTVDIVVNGATHPQRTVTAGSITLQTPASKVHVGLSCRARLQTLRSNAGAADGTSQGKKARISEVNVRLLDTLGLRYGASFDDLLEMPFRTPADLMDNAVPLFTGDVRLDWPGDYDDNPWLCFEQSDPLPSTIVAIMPQVTVYDKS